MGDDMKDSGRVDSHPARQKHVAQLRHRGIGQDLLDIGFDFFLAVFVPFLIFGSGVYSEAVVVFCGVVGGVLPDALQFAYFKFRHEPLFSLQKFHGWIHAERKIESRMWGLASQFVLCAFVIFLSY